MNGYAPRGLCFGACCVCAIDASLDGFSRLPYDSSVLSAALLIPRHVVLCLGPSNNDLFAETTPVSPWSVDTWGVTGSWPASGAAMLHRCQRVGHPPTRQACCHRPRRFGRCTALCRPRTRSAVASTGVFLDPPQRLLRYRILGLPRPPRLGRSRQRNMLTTKSR